MNKCGLIFEKTINILHYFFFVFLKNAVTSTSSTTASIFADLPLGNSRVRREVFNSLPLDYSGNWELNELSHRVLRSIEAALVAQSDHGNCLRRVLCEDNRHAKNTDGGQRIWIPVWRYKILFHQFLELTKNCFRL